MLRAVCSANTDIPHPRLVASGIKLDIPVSQHLEDAPMSLWERENQLLGVGQVQDMEAYNAFNDPPGCRVLNRLAHLIWNGPVCRSQLLTNAIFQGCIHQ
jgi:hypothetical protein